MILRRFRPGKSGWIEVITGCMFSGKTEEAIRRARRAMIARQKIVAFKHASDNRYDPVQIASHGGTKLMAIPVDNAAQMETHVRKGTCVIIVDEAQFFDDDLVEFVIRHRDAGRRIIVSGLNMDFARRPFDGPMGKIMLVANEISVQVAVCTVCGGPAHFSQRLSASRALKVVGERKDYAARCQPHHDPNPLIDM